MITNPNTDPNDLLPDTVTLYTSDQDSDTYLFEPDSGTYVRVTGDDGLAADASTPMAELQIAGADGQPIVLFPGAVAPPEPVYTAGPVITNPNTDPNDLLPDTVTLYTSDQDSDTYLLEPDSGTYVRVTGDDGLAADASTPMAELQIVGADGQPPVLFPGAVAPPEPVYTAGPVITNPNTDPNDLLPDTVTLYTSDQDSDTYLLEPDSGTYVRVTGDDGLAADASTPMAELQIAGADGQPIVLFPGAVAPPEPVYTAGPVITNPNTDPNDLLPDTVTLYTSDQDSDTYLLEPDSGTYVRVTGDDGLAADASTPMAELQIAGADGQPIVLFPGAVAPPEPVYTAGPVITNPNTDPNDLLPDTVTLYTSDQDSDTYLLEPDSGTYVE